MLDAASRTPLSLLRDWIADCAAPDAFAWFEGRLALAAADSSERDLHITLGLIPRRLGKTDLALDAAALDAAAAARPGWRPVDWSLDGAARLLTLLTLPAAEPGRFAERFKTLRITADAAELIALFRGLPLYPEPDALAWEAGEALRSNLKPVFEAVAHRNPYPKERFDEHRWNQMVLKALFIGAALHPIDGLDARANPELARIMRDFAHERWAAGRPAPYEIWRIVGPFSDDADAVADLTRALAAKEAAATELTRKAAALGLASSPSPEAKAHLAQSAPELKSAIESGALTWETLAAENAVKSANAAPDPVLPNATPAGA
ncbi:MAG: EboA domain-containing protein [Pseudomonadota bacterium]